MQINTGDIIIRKEKISKSVWLSECLVLQTCVELNDGLLRYNRNTYKNSLPPTHRTRPILPDSGKAWRWARINNTFYYAYANIPNRKPCFYKSMLPTEEELIKLAVEAEKPNAATLASEFTAMAQQKTNSHDVHYYMFYSEPCFNQQKAEQLALATGFCRLITELLDGSRFKKWFKKKEDLYENFTKIIAPLELEGLKISKPATLRNKITGFPDSPTEQLNYLVSAKYGNDHARLVGTFQIIHPETGELMKFDAHEAIMYEAWMNPFNANKRNKIDLYTNDYKPALEQYGLHPVSHNAFCKYLNRFDNKVLMSKERDGDKHFNDTYKPYVPAHLVQYAHTMWVGDGSGTKLAYSYMHTDRKTNKTVLKQATLYLVRITDVASRMIIGYAFGTSESPDLVKKALKMAIKTAGNIEALEFLSDNGSAFTVADVKSSLNLIFKKVRNIKPGNSQENPAEMHVKMLTNMCRGNNNWLYSGFHANHINNTTNPDYFPKLNELPSMEETHQQVLLAIEKYNNTPWGADQLTPIERFKNKNPECKPIEPRVLRHAFGNRTEVDLSYMRGFVNVHQVQGDHIAHFKFEIPDYDRNIHTISERLSYQSNAKVMVCWDEQAADIYTPEGAYILTAKRAELATKSTFEATDISNKALGKHLQRKVNMTTAADAMRDLVIESADVMKYGHRIYRGKAIKDEYNQEMEEYLAEQIQQSQNKSQAKMQILPTALTQEQIAFNDFF
jgi:hypothetical protein